MKRFLVSLGICFVLGIGIAYEVLMAAMNHSIMSGIFAFLLSLALVVDIAYIVKTTP